MAANAKGDVTWVRHLPQVSLQHQFEAASIMGERDRLLKALEENVKRGEWLVDQVLAEAPMAEYRTARKTRRWRG